jgi:lipoprotein-anchoring transpeptidase ErfK/SrfK
MGTAPAGAVPMARGRHSSRRKLGALAIAAIVAGVMILGAGGAAFAAYRYEAHRTAFILPGVTVGGVDVGGMTRDEAISAVRSASDDQLSAPIVVALGGRTWDVSAAELGERAAVEAAVDRAVAVGDSMTALERFWHRFRNRSVGVAIPLDYSVGSDLAIRSFLERVAKRVHRVPSDAEITVADDGQLDFVQAAPGRKLAMGPAVDAVLDALASDRALVELTTRSITPKVTRKTLGPTIVVRTDVNRLYLYDGFHVVHTYDVATAKPGYTTPDGVWTIWDKRVDPTWYNPALDSWGAGLPAVIPGGPGNPMGTRALYIDAPGLIRIHGTSDDSSIGRWASHGCIRMHNSEIEDLYEKVSIGTRVIVVGHRPSWAQEWDVPTNSDI